MPGIKKSQVAESTPFDNSTNGFLSDDVQAAIEEVNNTVATSASPGFSFGRESAVNSGTWLKCEGVPSNKAGRYIYIDNAVVRKVFISNELITTFGLEVYYHYGDEIGLTLLGSIDVVNNRGGAFTVNWPVPTGSQVAILQDTGNSRNCVGGLELSGSDI